MDTLKWFTHDYRGYVGQIRSLLSLYKVSKEEQYLTKIDLVLTQQAHLVSLFTNNELGNLSVEFNFKQFAEHSNSPKINIIVVKDFKMLRHSNIMYLIGILSEVSRNAYKAGASQLNVTINENKITFENNGKPIENADKIFTQGYSEFGTSGEGLNHIQEMVKWITNTIGGIGKYELINVSPVTFELFFSDSEILNKLNS